MLYLSNPAGFRRVLLTGYIPKWDQGIVVRNLTAELGFEINSQRAPN